MTRYILCEWQAAKPLARICAIGIETQAEGPSILLQRSAWRTARSTALDTLVQLLAHNYGLLCRGARAGDDIADLSLITDVLGVSLAQHAMQLFALRTSEPLLYAAVLGGPAGPATAMAAQSSAATINQAIVARQLLLNRTLYFQRAVTFVHVCGILPITRIFPGLHLHRKQKVGAGLAWLEALNTAATRSLGALYLTKQDPDKPIKMRGAKKRPERWVSAIVQAFWKRHQPPTN